MAYKDVTQDIDYSTFTDDGCKVYPKCLSCPLAFCIYETETEENQPKAIMTGIIKCWDSGDRLPGLLDMYTWMGDMSLVPEDVAEAYLRDKHGFTVPERTRDGNLSQEERDLLIAADERYVRLSIVMRAMGRQTKGASAKLRRALNPKPMGCPPGHRKGGRG